MTIKNLFAKSATAEKVSEGLDLSDRTILVTGCNSGLGFETMRVLASRGARVLGTARTKILAKKACAQIMGDAVPLSCELSEPGSIRAAIDAVQEPLHAIVANAGVMALQEKSVMHGTEAHMFINHVSHFMLVNGLRDQLTPNGRVVVLSSGAHAYARGKNLDFEDLGWNRPYKPWVAYGYSKLANILFVRELARRLPKGQTANALHPGIVDTGLWRYLPEDNATKMKNSFSLKSTEQGAATSVFLAAHPAVANISGEYFNNCSIAKPSAHAGDEKLGKRLWELSEELVATL
jgi:NAD(P)-dependent dehydrogenase (short-subunit alcohol dehydrogenase family)